MANTIPENTRIAFCCGELSGDEHAAKLVMPLLHYFPDAQFKGMGGRNLRDAGVDTIVDSEYSAAVMGFSELIGSAGRIVDAFKRMQKLILEWKPQLLILVDYPDFNLRLARFAKKHGVKTLFYIAPKVWAWRKGRIRSFIKYIDRMAVIFPFEEKFLREHGYLHAIYVGHPFIDYLNDLPPKTRSQLRAELGVAEDVPLLAVFPGSRKAEIKRLLSVMMEGLAIFLKKHPNVQALINVAPSLDINSIQKLIPLGLPVKIVKHDSIRVLQCADAGFLKSGTTNLQAALCKLPFVMFYMASPLSAFVARSLLKIKEFSIVNILKSGTVPEILQEQTQPERINRELTRIMFGFDCRSKMTDDFTTIYKSLEFPSNPNFNGLKRTAERTARVAHELLTR